ncbi:MAG TPA: 30S ribosomal protein S9 [Candidatus Kapabacteria bacterium]|mgnify:FL=1|jgi:small subunit ribosomal protein S9|nr:30S ribosomal protein S9 [Candidatus Kapabacteria bacterium]HPU23674.1 30S ribosomal protein S9 [Candidatus Kapabacteria bacterium]
MKVYSATGRRKTSVAQVRLVSGTGKVLINKRTIDDYFPVEVWRIHALSPLQVTDNLGKFDVFVNVRGGGLTGQSGAIRLGIARALVEYDEQLRGKLREYELLTRDPRMVERKKYGQKKARKRFQFSKR